jgi:Zn-dependent M28 family amino/carboxypeptidase
MSKLLLLMHLVSINGTRRVRGDISLQRLQPHVSRGLGAPKPVLQLHEPLNLPRSDSWFANEADILDAASTRFITSEGISAAAVRISQRFKSIGLDVLVDKFTFNSTEVSNIIGIRRGNSDQCVLIGAHYDSLPESGPAPGADDNASGVASLISVAEALKGAGQLNRCVMFVAFAGEEQEMIGSRHFLKDFKMIYKIQNSIILDQNGNPGSSSGIILESVGRSDAIDRLIDTLADCVESPIAKVEVNYNGFGSDHISFAEVGIPSVLVIERDNMELSKAYGHTARDTISNINPDFGSGIARMVTKAALKLAMN